MRAPDQKQIPGKRETDIGAIEQPGNAVFYSMKPPSGAGNPSRKTAPPICRARKLPDERWRNTPIGRAPRRVQALLACKNTIGRWAAASSRGITDGAGSTSMLHAANYFVRRLGGRARRCDEGPHRRASSEHARRADPKSFQACAPRTSKPPSSSKRKQTGRA